MGNQNQPEHFEKKEIKEKDDLNRFLSSYRIIKTLEENKSRKIMLVNNIKNGKLYKFGEFIFKTKKNKSDIDRDIKNLQKIKSKYTFHIHDFFIGQTKDEEKAVYLVMDFFEDDESLEDIIKKNINISSTSIWQFFIRLVIALDSLDFINMTFLNLTPKNIFFNKYNYAKIGGFETVFNFIFNINDIIKEEISKFLEPEKKDIVWSLGSILFLLKFKYEFNGKLFDCEDKDLMYFLNKILSKNRQIYSINEIIVDKIFFKKLFDLDMLNEMIESKSILLFINYYFIR